ncbi:MAG: hypothetical protein ABI728_10040 [Betaproteobacteria bacterium]
MLVSRSRDKLIQPILYFADRTRGVSKIKLYDAIELANAAKIPRRKSGARH